MTSIGTGISEADVRKIASETVSDQVNRVVQEALGAHGLANSPADGGAKTKPKVSAEDKARASSTKAKNEARAGRDSDRTAATKATNNKYAGKPEAKGPKQPTYAGSVDHGVEVFHKTLDDGGGGAQTRLAWDVSLGTDPANSNNSIITVWPGTVNGLIASNYADQPSVATTGTFYLSARVVTSGQSVTGVSIVSAASAPHASASIKNALPNTLDILFAVVVKRAVFQIRHGNFTISTQEVFRLEKTVTTPGTLPYDAWWNWSIAP